jgi:hypothetical protein
MMGYQYQRYLVDSGYYDITPEQEEEIYEAEEIARLEAHARDWDEYDLMEVPAAELVDEADMYPMWVVSHRLPFTLAYRRAA